MGRNLIQLSFDGLSKLDDERVSKVLLFHLQRIAQDCIARPGDKTKRRVLMEFQARPQIGDDGSCESAHIQIEIRSKVPTHRSKPYEMQVGREGFKFNQDFPEDLESQSLFPKTEGEEA